MAELDIVDDPDAYGSKGQSWHADFVSYMVEIVTHPAYAGMPDAIKPDGKVQWEAPSNRQSGQFQHTHHRRRDWWQAKALQIGIDPSADRWISTVAKRIHPLGEKPCKRCGRTMRIAYAYPNGHLQRRLLQEFGQDFEIDPFESITELVQRVTDQFGDARLLKFRNLLSTDTLTPPLALEELDAWISWLEDEYIPHEPSLLSPGAMSNAPDRFDGFHSFNLCCRKKADTGRIDANMRTYTTDRRVFEYWSDGDWIAADRMMGLISAQYRNELTADGREGPPSADHIGPVSLGFAHRPQFRLLSKSANSAKNNRMTLVDVADLLKAERMGDEVASWYAKPLWDLRKSDAISEELCLRLSKQLRDNQRIAMHLLVEAYKAGHFAFLSSLLNLHRADFNVEFCGLRISNYVPTYDSIKHSPRKTKYASEQKARRLRVGFEALRAYGEKENRHSSFIPVALSPDAERHLTTALEILLTCDASVSEVDEAIKMALFNSDSRSGEQALRDLVQDVPRTEHVQEFVTARRELEQAMKHVGNVISSLWSDDRYVRAKIEDLS